MSASNEPADTPDNLGAYRAKRSADRTPEPFGGGVQGPGRLFVVHKHAARNLHFDLRLEMDGVLKSWAVPRGPSYDPADKRLAVFVEDHPLEYGDFEGVIPDGNYGAGGVIVWDRGEWVPLEDPGEGLRKGKLLFELKGYKLRGKWTLVKIKKEKKEWLLIKERDAWVKKEDGHVFPEESVLSGLTVEQVKAGHTPVGLLRAELERLEAPRKWVNPESVDVMLAEPREEAFTKAGWLFELKMDGYRLLACRQHGEVRLYTRNGGDYTKVFPEIERAMQALPFENVILDGEVVVLDGAGKPSFSGLQKRGRLTRPTDIRRASIEFPATYFAFDLLALEDFDVRPLPLGERKALLRRVLPPLGPVRYLDHVDKEGVAFLERVTAMGLEGIVAKKSDASYQAGRSSQWLKIKGEQTADFAIVGFTAPKGSRAGMGALQLADYLDGDLVYAGRAGTGFTEKQLKELRGLLEPHARSTPSCKGPIPLGPGRAGTAEPVSRIPDTKTTTWVEPTLVCEVRFREWTPDGLLRHPVYLRLRDDKSLHECTRAGNQTVPADDPVEEAAAATPESRTVQLTNLKKVFWPEDGLNKGDLIGYYREIAPWILPYLKGRPVVMTRFPDGIHGKQFYQKDAPDFAPAWIRRVAIWSEDTQREIHYFVCDDVDALVYIANLGSIPLHVWASRVGTLEQPDWCVIDLDPKEASFSDVITLALAMHRLCEEVRLPNFVKTTGKTGLHILIPLGRQCTYEQSRTLGELLSRIVIKEHSDIATITRHVTKRGDKVYLDYLQNRHGQLIVAPFSVRPLPGATVSMPLVWDDVNEHLDPKRFTILNARGRMEALGTDPCRAVLELKPDFVKVLSDLGERFATTGGGVRDYPGTKA